ncbi:MAG: hypothetical protein PWQ96_458 [Clostridia bacterium]|jgi:hypothetical protein|nr:hypothetical protein [Clostridiales bacterium]MDK2984816.1 hypothetical protein [Clostridia bacterium]
MGRYSVYVSPFRNELKVFGKVNGEEQKLFFVNGFEEGVDFTSMSEEKVDEYSS